MKCDIRVTIHGASDEAFGVTLRVGYHFGWYGTPKASVYSWAPVTYHFEEGDIAADKIEGVCSRLLETLIDQDITDEQLDELTTKAHLEHVADDEQAYSELKAEMKE